MKKVYLLLVMLTIAGMGFGQTTVSYDFSASGAVSGLNEASPGIALDANIGFGSFKNNGTSNPAIYSGQLRLYQNATKGGSIKIYASNGVTITQVIVHASSKTGPAGYTVDGGAETTLSGGSTYTMSGLSATNEVEFYDKGSSSSTRIYVDNFEVTYTTSSSGVDSPTAFAANTISTSEIDLSWTQNANSDNVMVAWSTDGTFGTPADGSTYSAGDVISGGGTVLYNGSATSFNHTSLTSGTHYYYMAWSVDASTNYSGGVADDATTYKDEPTNHVSAFSAGTPTSSTIPLSWSDNDGTVAADGFLIMINTTGTFTPPVDGTEQSDDTDVTDGSGQINVAHGTELYRWRHILQGTHYYFTIYPYTNSGAAINYKTDGTVPDADATTTTADGAWDLFISEYIEGSGNNRALEIYNGTGADVDLSNYQIWKVTNGGSWPEYTLSLTGTIRNGDVLVIYNTSADAAITSVGDVSWGSANWNGDDAVGLAKKDGSGTFALIDAVGTDGADPGSGWDVAGVTNATKNHTLVRKAMIFSPTTNWSSSAGTTTNNSQWIVYDSDDFTYIGSHTYNVPAIPLSDWALILSILLITSFVVIKFKFS